MKRTTTTRDVGIVFLGYGVLFLGRWFFFARAESGQLLLVGLMAVSGLAFLGVGLWNKNSDDQ
jgi:hypothetical protein